jgi:uncharacterized membrane protein YfcA
MAEWLPVGPLAFAACALAVLVAYVIFGLTSFGAPLIAAPVLAHFLPLTLAIPLQSSLDLIAAAVLGGRDRKQIAWRELRWLIVPMMIGMILGTTLLIELPKRASLVALGIFVVVFGIAGLTDRLKLPPLPRFASFIVVTIGGVLSSLFAAGGPVYVMHLTNRLTDPLVLRSTIAATALLSAALRVGLFALSGLLLVPGLWIAILAFVPALVLGVYIGRWLQRALAPRINRALIYALLVVTGVSLIWRFV